MLAAISFLLINNGNCLYNFFEQIIQILNIVSLFQPLKNANSPKKKGNATNHKQYHTISQDFVSDSELSDSEQILHSVNDETDKDSLKSKDTNLKVCAFFNSE